MYFFYFSVHVLNFSTVERETEFARNGLAECRGIKQQAFFATGFREAICRALDNDVYDDANDDDEDDKELYSIVKCTECLATNYRHCSKIKLSQMNACQIVSWFFGKGTFFKCLIVLALVH